MTEMEKKEKAGIDGELTTTQYGKRIVSLMDGVNIIRNHGGRLSRLVNDLSTRQLGFGCGRRGRLDLLVNCPAIADLKAVSREPSLPGVFPSPFLNPRPLVPPLFSSQTHAWLEAGAAGWALAGGHGSSRCGPAKTLLDAGP